MVVSTKLVVPVLLWAGAVAIVVKFTPSVERCTIKPVSFVALSVQVRLTCGPACSAALNPLGARITATEADTDWTFRLMYSPPYPTVFMASTRYEETDLPDLNVASV